MSIYGFYPDSAGTSLPLQGDRRGHARAGTPDPGDTLNVVGPLGNGFTFRRTGAASCWWRAGVGLATLAPLALEAERLGRRLTAICSARAPELLMSLDDFRDLGAEVVPVTDMDGTSGVELARARSSRSGSPTRAWTRSTPAARTACCKLLQSLGKRHGIPGEVALEQQMACGLGMCHCCVRPFLQERVGRALRVCREGPVFHMQEAMAW